MATKNKLPSAFRNESLGLWYDAKSTVAQNLADLKTQVNFRKQNFEIQMKVNNPIMSFNSQMQNFGQQNKDAVRILNSFNGEFTRFKQTSS